MVPAGLSADQVSECFLAEALGWQWPESVVYFGGQDSGICALLVKDLPQLRVLPLHDEAAISLSDNAQRQRTLVLIEDQIPGQQIVQSLLATVRDRVGSRLILWSRQLPLSDALALGFRRYPAVDSMFVYDLFDYKRRPDWFNSRHFANPEQWDSFQKG